jgi:hypothetical protein
MVFLLFLSFKLSGRALERDLLASSRDFPGGLYNEQLFNFVSLRMQLPVEWRDRFGRGSRIPPYERTERDMLRR